MTSLTPLLSSDGMRAADAATISDWAVPARVLMETAGRAAASAIADRFALAGRRVTVLAGSGNNGGDALVVARLLWQRGAVVSVVSLDPEAGSEDRRANRELLGRLADGADRLSLWSDPAEADLVVDGLLGIGVSGPLREPVGGLCEWTNRQAAPVVALDVPSGLDATTGAAADGTVRAELTVTFGAAKTGLALRDGPAHAGEVLTVEIGIPDGLLRDHAAAWRASAGWIAARLPRRAADANKYSAGTAVCVVGSRRYTGAAALSTGAAYRAGAGAVRACTPESARTVLDLHALEVMAEGFTETDAGGLAPGAFEAIAERIDAADAALVGCGLGDEAPTQSLVRDLVLGSETPLVLDADGLGAFAGHADTFRQRTAPLVVTPHLGEYRRLVGDPDLTPDDLVETVRDAAARWDAVVVLKGMPSVVGAPDGRVVVGPPGQPALATAGTGDVLAGTVVGLMAQGLGALEAAVCALSLGSTAVEVWADARGLAPSRATGLVASDLVEALPDAAARLAP